MDRVFPGDAPTQGDTTYFSVADKDGMMVSWIQSNYRGMGSGLVPDGADGRPWASCSRTAASCSP